MSSRVFTLIAVATADVARSAWVMDAVLDADRMGNVHPWLALGLALLTGAISVSLIAIAARATLEAIAQVPAPPSS